jgi:hypothetical protein
MTNHGVIADDHAGIRVALGGEGVKARADFGEADLLVRKVALRCESAGHVSSLRKGL